MLEHGHHHRHDIGTHGCDDQLPLMAVVGRGIAGDTYRVKISEPDSCTETHLEGELTRNGIAIGSPRTSTEASFPTSTGFAPTRSRRRSP